MIIAWADWCISDITQMQLTLDDWRYVIVFTYYYSPIYMETCILKLSELLEFP
jgi:hypothetical protein